MALPFIDERTKALLSLGFIQWTDALFAFLTFGHLATIAAWFFFGHPTVTQLLLVTASLLFFVQVWLVTLAYRACFFIIMVTAEIKNMPAAAARLAMQFGATAA